MISDNDNALENAEQNFKDVESYLKSGGKPVTSADISNMERCVVDSIKSGIEHNIDENKETPVVLGVSLKNASESLKYLSIALSPLSRQVTKGLSNAWSSSTGKVKKGCK